MKLETDSSISVVSESGPTERNPGPASAGPRWLPWLVAGCSGCVLVLIVGMIVGGVAFFNFFKGVNKSVGTVTESTAIRDIGKEIPSYPKSVFDDQITRELVVSMRTMEKMTGKAQGGILRGLAVRTSEDTTAQILEFYDRELGSRKWMLEKSLEKNSAHQHLYRKNSEVLIVQVQPEDKGKGVKITLMRGGGELSKYYQQKTPSGGSPSR